VHVWRAAKLLS